MRLSRSHGDLSLICTGKWTENVFRAYRPVFLSSILTHPFDVKTSRYLHVHFSKEEEKGLRCPKRYRSCNRKQRPGYSWKGRAPNWLSCRQDLISLLTAVSGPFPNEDLGRHGSPTIAWQGLRSAGEWWKSRIVDQRGLDFGWGP